MSHVKIPAKAVADENDILEPLTRLLSGLNLQGKPEETKQAGEFASTFTGPPQSVALIEAGATAANKWWSAGLGAVVVTAWTSVLAWWAHLDSASQRTTLVAAAIVTAAAVLGIAYLLGSDVRGRGAAAVATIRARTQLAATMIQAAQTSYAATPASPAGELVALPAPIDVNYVVKPRDEEQGWCAIALLSDGKNVTRYLVFKDGHSEWVDSADVELIAPADGRLLLGIR